MKGCCVDVVYAEGLVRQDTVNKFIISITELSTLRSVVAFAQHKPFFILLGTKCICIIYKTLSQLRAIDET